MDYAMLFYFCASLTLHAPLVCLFFLSVCLFCLVSQWESVVYMLEWRICVYIFVVCQDMIGVGI